MYMLNILLILLGHSQQALFRFVPAKSDTAYSSVQNNLLNQKQLDCRLFESDLIECFAYNLFLRNSNKFRNLDPENVLIRPILTRQFSNQSVARGDNATFTCQTQMDSFPMFLFYKLSKDIMTKYSDQKYDISSLLDQNALALQKKDSFSDYMTIDDRFKLERRQHIEDSNKDSFSDLETVNLKILKTNPTDQGYYLCIVANSPKSFRVTYGFLNVTDSADFEHKISLVEKNLQSFFDQNKYSITVGFFAVLLLVLAITMSVCMCHINSKSKDRKMIVDNTMGSMKKNFLYVSMPDNGSQTTNSTLNNRLGSLDQDVMSNNSDTQLIPEEDPEWEFPREKLKLSNLIDEGAFGRVFKAEAYGILPGRYRSCVAVKTLKEKSSKMELSNFIKELEIMKSVGRHENILSLLGCCTKNGPVYAIVEYAKLGNLKNYLRSQRPTEFLASDSDETELEGSAAQLATDVLKLYSSINKHKVNKSDKFSTFGYAKDKNKFSTDSELDLIIELVKFCCQISNGMRYLHSKKVCHRDLAARNILLDENKVAKIADFGFARDLQQNYYYTRSSESPIPVKWMAPESLLDRKVYPNSDIWSFGVLMWEVFTLGGSPYPTVPIEKLFDYLKEGNRMSRPELCDEEMYDLMLDCWNISSELRPSFAVINERLEVLLAKYENKRQENNFAELEKLFDKNTFGQLTLNSSQKKLLTTNLTINPLAGPVEPLLSNSSSVLTMLNSNRNSSLSNSHKLAMSLHSKRVVRNSESEDSQYFSGADSSLVYTDSSNYSNECSSVYSNYTMPISVFSEASKMAASLGQAPPSPPPPKSFSKLLNLASAAYQL
ncbi:Vascular endothelial growth factor receptor [Brachionus plicatilis]|uniref:receptor protein-tyrosine kinase n=1 Tax=Brachionus plicatilis TaxID=10195 RepID=A0A3M7SWN4_BRAPC|nr:Vascular endothelial growth factor receptor [Brachionus plicatilis]